MLSIQSELKDVDVVSELLPFVHVLRLTTSLHFTHHYFLEVVEHSFLLHTWRVFLRNSLSLQGQLIPFFGIFLNFGLDVLLIASAFWEPLATPFDVVILLIEPLHFELYQLVFELVNFYLCVHGIDLVPDLVDNSLNFLNIILDLGGNSQEGLFLGLVLILYGLELL